MLVEGSAGGQSQSIKVVTYDDILKQPKKLTQTVKQRKEISKSQQDRIDALSANHSSERRAINRDSLVFGSISQRDYEAQAKTDKLNQSQMTHHISQSGGINQIPPVQIQNLQPN